MGDRLKGPLLALARRADPLTLYRAMYRARLVSQSADLLRLDVAPDDPLLPRMSNVPLRHGIPGLTVSVAPGASILVGWDNGRPDAPFAALWANPNETGAGNARGTTAGGSGAALRTSVVAQLLELGKYDAIDWIIKGSTYRAAEAQLHSTLNTELGAAAAGLATAGLAATHVLAKPGLAAAGVALTAAVTALAAFEAQSGTFLSTIVRTG